MRAGRLGGWRLALGLPLVLSAALACAGAMARSKDHAPDPIVLDGWRLAEHAGLTIYTNASDATARRAFRQLSRFIDYVSQLVSGHPFEANRRLEVFVFGARSEYLRFAPEMLAGHARRGDGENQIALSIEQIFEGTRTLYHELVHTVLHNDPDRSFPNWFHEGLAGFFDTSVLRGDVLTVGGLSPTAVQQMRLKRPLPLRRLLASPASGQRDIELFYADAWAFVHFGLRSASMSGPDRRDAFGSFVSRVSRGEAWEPAFLAAFAATPEEIAEEYERHRKRLVDTQVLTLSNVTLALDEPALVFAPLGRLEIARELAQLGLGYDAGTESAALLLDLLLEADPDDPEAIYGRIRVAVQRGELDLAGALWERLADDQRQGLAARQAEADLALERARALRLDERATVGAENLARAIAGYRHVLVNAPDRLSALVGLGQALVLSEHEDPAAGISALERAIEMAPESPRVRLDLAELMIRTDALSAAEPHLDYVVEAYPHSPWANRAKRLRRKTR